MARAHAEPARGLLLHDSTTPSAHLTLVRPATTLAELIGRLLQMGVMAIDVGLTNPPRHQRASQASAEPLRSYVLDHPGAYIDHRLDGLESSHA